MVQIERPGEAVLDALRQSARSGRGAAQLRDASLLMLGSAAWQSIADPMFAAAGVDPKKIKYQEGGWPQWGTVLASGSIYLAGAVRTLAKPKPVV